MGETSVFEQATVIGACIEAVWRYWCEQRKPKRTDLEPAQSRLISKGLRAGFTSEELCRAIDALLASDWHREHKKLQLSVIFATRPGGPTLRDQIEGWIERSPSTQPAGAVTSPQDVRAGHLNALKADVMRGWHRDRSKPAPTRDARERATAAIEGLKGYGVNVRFEDDGRPVFE